MKLKKKFKCLMSYCYHIYFKKKPKIFKFSYNENGNRYIRINNKIIIVPTLITTLIN